MSSHNFGLLRGEGKGLTGLLLYRAWNPLHRFGIILDRGIEEITGLLEHSALKKVLYLRVCFNTQTVILRAKTFRDLRQLP